MAARPRRPRHAHPMPEEKYTRCPGCATVFRVKPEQLALRNGQVRCGHCKTVFDGVAQAVSLAPQTRTTHDEPPLDEAALGPPTVTLRDARALEPAPGAPVEADIAPPGDASAEAPYEDRFAPPARPASGRRRLILYAIAIVVLRAGDSRPGDLSLPRRDRRALAAGPAGSAEPVRRGGVRDPSASRRRDGVPVDRGVRSAGRSGAPGAADPHRNVAQPGAVGAFLSVSRVDAHRCAGPCRRAPRARAGRLRGRNGRLATRDRVERRRQRSRCSSMRARRPRLGIGSTCSTREVPDRCARPRGTGLVRHHFVQ